MPQLKKQDTLFSRQKTKTTIAIQTDADTSRVDSRGVSRNKSIRKMDSTVKKTDSSAQFEESHASRGALLKNRYDPDKYKEDWIDSLVFKRAMKAEAIKRGVHVDSEWEVDEEEERVAMTNADAVTLQGDADQDNSAGSVDELDMANAQDPDFCVQHGGSHGLGFLKATLDKGNIRMLSESEVLYIKTLLK